mmetsp:Transcript_17458/g.25800  ORF Transcript_17458/g.25800 Transcript_17458/m.25800 type:complete len:492 (-) Transcript_17458:42-1517(-)
MSNVIASKDMTIETSEQLNSPPEEESDSYASSEERWGENDMMEEHWALSQIATLGSGYSLMASGFMLFLAVGFRVWITQSAASTKSTGVHYPYNYTVDELYRTLGPVPSIDPPIIYEVSNPLLNDSLLEMYNKNGVIAVRGLISGGLLQNLDKESTQVLSQMDEDGKLSKSATTGKQFHAVKNSLAFQNLSNNVNMTTAFLNVSLFSNVPQAAAHLLSGNSGVPTKNLRLIRDIFLTKDQDPYVCGWHVDDFGFWPTTAVSPGINAWIALDDMPIETGGGFALAVGSHTANWKDQAHLAIGATTTAPSTGYESSRDLFVHRTGGGTCNLETTAPHLHRRMEDTMRVYNLKRGDVIFHHRWLFHRTVAMNHSHNKIYRRYSLRYGSGSTSAIQPGFGTEPSVLWNQKNGGRTLDQIAKLDGPWYPQAYPQPLTEELDALPILMKTKMPTAEEKKAANLREMQPYLQQIAKRQQENKRSDAQESDWCDARVNN